MLCGAELLSLLVTLSGFVTIGGFRPEEVFHSSERLADLHPCWGEGKSFQQSLGISVLLSPSLSPSLSLCPVSSVSLSLILLPQQLPPAALITTSTKYPVENRSSLIPDCSILSLQRHYFLSRRLGYQGSERLQGTLLIHWHSLVSPTLDLSELKGGASHSTTKLCGKAAPAARMCTCVHAFLLEHVE